MLFSMSVPTLDRDIHLFTTDMNGTAMPYTPPMSMASQIYSREVYDCVCLFSLIYLFAAPLDSHLHHGPFIPLKHRYTAPRSCVTTRTAT